MIWSILCTGGLLTNKNGICVVYSNSKRKTWWFCEPNHTSHGVSQKQDPSINPTQASNWPKFADWFSLQKKHRLQSLRGWGVPGVFVVVSVRALGLPQLVQEGECSTTKQALLHRMLREWRVDLPGHRVKRATSYCRLSRHHLKTRNLEKLL